jgi:zinc protease
VVENPTADIVAARIFIKAGGLHEPLHQSGLSHLLMASLTRGTGSRTALDIAEQVESMGASLGTDANSDYCLLSLKSVSADFPDLFQLAAQILRQPSFPETEIELERRLALQALRSQQEQPYTIAFENLRQAMYVDHPYAFGSLGSASSVQTLSKADLHAFHDQYFRPDNMVISIAGRIDAQTAQALVEEQFADWVPPTSAIQNLSPSALAPQSQRIFKAQNSQQVILMLAYLTASVHESDYAALKLISSYLGNGLSSRLFVELRDKRGLAYDVSAFYPTRLSTAPFVTYIGTAPHNAAIALDGMTYEVNRLCEQPLSAEELQTTQSKILGQYALGKQTNAQLAQIYGWYETLGLGIEFDLEFQHAIAGLTVADVQAAAQKYLQTPYLSVVGPDAAIAALDPTVEPVNV